MASIIPSPGTPAGAPNVSETITVGPNHVIAAGTTLYTDSLSLLLTASGFQFPPYGFVNNGALWNRKSSGGFLFEAFNAGAIVNNGLMVMEASAGQALTISVSSSFAGLTNSGQIYALATGGAARAFQDWSSSTLVNSGLIAARSDGQAIALFRVNGGQVINHASGSILAEGRDAVAVYLQRGDFYGGGPQRVTIDNAGRIEAQSTDPTRASVAILLDVLAVEADLIVNTGTIRGDYAILAEHDYLYRPADTFGETILNEPGGLIEGDIQLGLASDSIFNRGTITGYVFLSDGSDRFENGSGILNGLVNLGWGSDIFAGGAGGEVALGDRGDDSLHGNGGNDLLLGGRGNDFIAGGSGNDGLYGEGGRDRILTLGGDRVVAGLGDDRVELGDYAFESVDGGGGLDLLVLADLDRIFDLSAALAAARLTGFEAIGLPGAQEIVIRPQDVAQLTGGGTLLTVYGGASGKVDLVGGWTLASTQTINGIQIATYSAGPAQLVVEGAASVFLLGSAPAGATGLDSVAAGGAAPLPGSTPGANLSPSDVIISNVALHSTLIIDSDEHWTSVGGAPVLSGGNPFESLTNHGILTSRGVGAGGATAIYLGAMPMFNDGTIEAFGSGDSSSLTDNKNFLATYGIDVTARNGGDRVIAIRADGSTGPVENAGTISASAEAGLAGGYINFGMNLVNRGSISTVSSDFVAVGVYAANGGRLINIGTITADGAIGAYGVRSSTHAVTVENFGTISASVHQAGGQAVALSFYYQLGEAVVVNTGTIRGDVAIQSTIMTNGGGLRLANSGLIEGRIELNAFAGGDIGRTDIIFNNGIINGEVRLGGERDVYFGAGGQQSGAVLGEAGMDLLFGTAGAESLNGGADADYLLGGGGADTLTGGAGGDVFVYRSFADSSSVAQDLIADFQTGVDRIDLTALGIISWSLQDMGGGIILLNASSASETLSVRISGAATLADIVVNGSATVNGTGGEDLLVATAGGSNVDGGDGGDMLVGSASADRLTGGAGLDMFWGGGGNDVFVVETSAELVWEAIGEGTDTVEFLGGPFSGTYVLPDNVENLVILAGAGGVGNGLANTITGNGENNFIDGKAGNDRMIGGLGNDVYQADSSGDLAIEDVNGGTDTVQAVVSYALGDNVENLTLAEKAGGIAGGGNALDNRIIGNESANLITAGGGADWVTGGDGIDNIFGESGADRLYGEAGEDVIEGGDGDDLIEGGSHGDTLRGGAGNDHIYGDSSPFFDPISGNNRPPAPQDFIGLDTIVGGAGADLIEAGVGADRIVYLLAGDSTAASQDRIRGFQSGLDKIDLTALDVNSLSWTEASDSNGLYSLVTVATPAGEMKIRVDGHVVLTDFMVGSGSGAIEGTDGDNQLDGTSGAETISGRGGDDSLRGYGGNDVLNGGNGTDTAFYAGNRADYEIGTAGIVTVRDLNGADGDEGTDTLENIEYIQFADVKVQMGIDPNNAPQLGQPAMLDQIWQDSVAAGYSIPGTAFMDPDGNGTLTFHAELADGSPLPSWLSFSPVTKSFSGTPPVDQIGASLEIRVTASDGKASISDTLILTVTMAPGADIHGTEGPDSLSGTFRDETMIGKGGDDVLYGSAGVDRIDGGAGSDEVNYSASAQSVTLDLPAMTAAGGDAEGDLLISIERVVGSGLDDHIQAGADFNRIDGGAGADWIHGGAGDDQLLGGSGDDTLLGGDHHDLLDGGLGADSMSGGLGNDVYLVDNHADLVTELAGEGTDEVRTGLSLFTLGSNIEKLGGTSASGQSLTGNGLANVIAGAGGDDIIDGGAGADQMAGGAGNDIYYLDDAGDSISELAGQGIDEIRTALASGSLFFLPDFENITGLGNIGQTLTGNSGDNVIDGGLGADTMNGGGGNDLYFVDNAGDTIGENGGEGTDEVRTALATYALGANVENLTGFGFVDQNLTGNGGDNVINGGAGADTMTGGLGNDVYHVDSFGDVVVENGGEGIDEIRTSLNGFNLLSTPNVERLVATTNDAHGFRGNGANNLLAGAGGNDSLFMQDGGIDLVDGGGGDDIIYFGGALNADDAVDGGTGSRDVLVLQGNYALALDGTTMRGVEFLSLQSGSITRFGDTAGNLYDYNLALTDANVGAGVQLVVNAQSLLAGEDLTFDGSAESDGRFLVYGGHGVDSLKGGAGNDIFFFEGLRFGPGDAVDGGGGRDSLVIAGVNGLNHIAFGETALTSIESISVNNRFATDPSAVPFYELVLRDGNVASGGAMTINASSLAAGQTVNVDAHLELDGSFSMFGGGGHDIFVGGARNDLLHGAGGADTLTGGGGADTFQYRSHSDSAIGASDRIADFTSGADRIDLSFMDANATAAGDQAFAFIGSGAFTGLAGQLRAVFDAGNAVWNVSGDVDGDGFADFLINVATVTADPIVASDFIL